MSSWLKQIVRLPDNTMGCFVATGVVVAAVWVGALVWEMSVETERKRNQWELDFVTKQIRELYGPLHFELVEGRMAWDGFVFEFEDDFRRSMPLALPSTGDQSKPPVVIPLTKVQWARWDYWKGNEFMPRNRRIEALLKLHADLIVGDGLPDGYRQFLDHFRAWSIEQKQSEKDAGAYYRGRYDMDWPRAFEYGIGETYTRLKRRQEELVDALQ